MQQNQQKSDSLNQQQQSLQEQLQQMQQQMQQNGMQSDSMQQAGQQMGSASENLGQGKPGGAAQNMEEVVAGLDIGTSSIKIILYGDDGLKYSDSIQHFTCNNEDNNLDPLGRSNPDEDLNVDPADEENLTREIRDKIRDRLENDDLTPEEREYLERLLENARKALRDIDNEEGSPPINVTRNYFKNKNIPP